VLAKAYRLPEETPGGIIIPETSRDAHGGFEYYEAAQAVAWNEKLPPEKEYLQPALLLKLGLHYVHEEAILRVRWQGADGVTGAAPADTGYDDERDGRALLVLLAEQIESVQIWK